MLTTCRECEQSVSSQAWICPHCGVRDPWRKPRTGLLRPVTASHVFFSVLGLMGLLILLIFIIVRTPSPRPRVHIAETVSSKPKAIPAKAPPPPVWEEAPVPEAANLPVELRPIASLLFSCNKNATASCFAGLDFDKEGHAHIRPAFREQLLSKYGKDQVKAELAALGQYKCPDCKIQFPLLWASLGGRICIDPDDQEIGRNLAFSILQLGKETSDVMASSVPGLLTAFYEATNNRELIEIPLSHVGDNGSNYPAIPVVALLFKRFPLQCIEAIQAWSIHPKTEFIARMGEDICCGENYGPEDTKRLVEMLTPLSRDVGQPGHLEALLLLESLKCDCGP